MLSTETSLKDILVVEDNDQMRQLYKEFFNDKKNYKVEIVNSASDGAKRLVDKDYHLIILDMIMERISGENFCDFVRRHSDFSHIPILMISVVEHQKLQEMSKRYGVSFLRKPITKDILMQKVSEALQ